MGWVGRRNYRICQRLSSVRNIEVWKFHSSNLQQWYSCNKAKTKFPLQLSLLRSQFLNWEMCACPRGWSQFILLVRASGWSNLQQCRKHFSKMELDSYCTKYLGLWSGTSFYQHTLGVLGNDYHILHKPTVIYSPWANGTVESLMRTVLVALRSMMFDLILAP